MSRSAAQPAEPLSTRVVATPSLPIGELERKARPGRLRERIGVDRPDLRPLPQPPALPVLCSKYRYPYSDYRYPYSDYRCPFPVQMWQGGGSASRLPQSDITSQNQSGFGPVPLEASTVTHGMAHGDAIMRRMAARCPYSD
jgi:hypothetical protein